MSAGFPEGGRAGASRSVVGGNAVRVFVGGGVAPNCPFLILTSAPQGMWKLSLPGARGYFGQSTVVSGNFESSFKSWDR